MKQEAHWQFTCPCVIINKLMKMEEENLLKERETFGSRLGFILVSAGCAVGLGNVWKFPYMTGKYGGAAFILIYLVFLVLLGLPILVSEFAVGRSSRLSTARAFHKLEPEGSNFHKYSYMGMIGNYMLMMFYTMVAGWMMYYCYVMATGKLSGATSCLLYKSPSPRDSTSSRMPSSA